MDTAEIIEELMKQLLKIFSNLIVSIYQRQLCKTKNTSENLNFTHIFAVFHTQISGCKLLEKLFCEGRYIYAVYTTIHERTIYTTETL